MERLTNHREFVAVLKGRRRTARNDIVVHFLVRDDSYTGRVSPQTRRLGLAVAKSVGNAVTRNTVKRRFRVLARQHEHLLPEGCDVVMRAKPGIDAVDFDSLDYQVASAFRAVARKVATA